MTARPSVPVCAYSPAQTSRRGAPRVQLPARAEVQIFSDGTFQYAEGGREALLCPVELDSGDLVDTVAWFSGQPTTWWLLLRIGTHLGDRALCHAAFLRESIRLVPSPSVWLSSPEGAVCVLDWTASLRTLFREVPEIWCSTPALAKHLRRRLDEQVNHEIKIRVST